MSMTMACIQRIHPMCGAGPEFQTRRRDGCQCECHDKERDRLFPVKRKAVAQTEAGAE